MFDFNKSNDNNSFYALSFHILCCLLIETNVCLISRKATTIILQLILTITLEFFFPIGLILPIS